MSPEKCVVKTRDSVWRSLLNTLVSRSCSCRSSRGLLRWAALFLGELRDGLTMINMQSAFLIVSKQYTEKQAGVLFFGKFRRCRALENGSS